jgi:hypothetical protein
VLVLAMPVLLGGVASAKLLPFSFEATPTHPRVGEPITLTMQCFEDVAHTESLGSCLGHGGPVAWEGGQMAWLHPLDLEGSLERCELDRRRGTGHRFGGNRWNHRPVRTGRVCDRPLWRDWGGKVEDPDEVGRGFPDPIRLEVVEPGVSVTAEVVEPSISVSAWATLLSAAAALAAGLTAWQLLRRRQHPV